MSDFTYYVIVPMAFMGAFTLWGWMLRETYPAYKRAKEEASQ